MRKETHAKKNTRWMKAVLLSFFALLLCSVSGYAQNITVTGKVSDAMGTLPGVSVAIKGTTNGTVTDVDGKYSLNVAKNATLVFSFVGMKSQEVTVNGRKVIDVTMTNDTELLDEVVVVGYGTSKKSSLTSAVSAVKGDELLKAPATNVSQLLGGRLPGISSLQESGEPGFAEYSWFCIQRIVYRGRFPREQYQRPGSERHRERICTEGRCLGCRLRFGRCRWCHHRHYQAR